MSRLLESVWKTKPKGDDNIQANSVEDPPQDRLDSQIAESLASSLRLNDNIVPGPNEPDQSARIETTTYVAQASRAEITISNSQMTAGRDVNVSSYNIGTVNIHRHEESEPDMENHRKEKGGRFPSYDNVAAGMPIPPVPACIIERDAQHDMIVNRLVTESHVRVALLGMGGIGKTTLACSIARDLKIMKAYPRRLFVSFEGSSTPDLAFASLANTFQVPASSRSSHVEILSHVLVYLEGTKTLLIIDNFETFWEVAAYRREADLLLGLLASLSSLAIIVTMRGNQRPSNISWMKIDPLQTLSPDGSKELLSVITEGTHNKTASDEECSNKLLDGVAGIPLAVTLIGCLLRDGSETVQSLWRRWSEESTRAISQATDPDIDDRLYRLDVSIRLTVFGPRMKDITRDVLAAISLLPVGLSLEEKWVDDLQSGLPSAINIRDCIRTLRNVALAAPTPDKSETLLGIDRLRILAPVRDFCSHNLASDNQIVRRVANLYYIKVKRIGTNYGVKEHYSWFTEEISNIAGVLNNSLGMDCVTDDLGYACSVYTSWLTYLDMPSTDIVECAVKAFAKNPAVKAECLQTWGYVLQNIERTTEAREKIEEALSIHRDLQLIPHVASGLSSLGKIHYSLRQFDPAERYLNEAVNLFTQVGDKEGKAIALGLLSDVLFAQKKLPEAERTVAESLKLSRDVGNRLEEAKSLDILGIIYRMQGRHALALQTLTASCDLCKDINYILGEAYANRDVAYVYWDIGELNQAALRFREAISLFQKANMYSYGIIDKVRADLDRVEAILSRRHY